MRRIRKLCLWKRVLAGAAGGFAGAVAMAQFQKGWTAAAQHIHPAADRSQSKKQKETKDESAPATIQSAQALWKTFGGGKFTEKQRQIAGPAMHYGFGTVSGAVYGALSGVPQARLGYGSVFGAVLWALADEAAVPALGFSKGPRAYPVTTHLYGLASHVVYGLAADGVSRGVQALL